MASSSTFFIAAVLALLCGPATSAHRAWPHSHVVRKSKFLTGDSGHRAGTNQDSLVATSTGGLLLQDNYAYEKLRRFNTEKIPERVVHSRGVGAFGVFQSFGDFSKLTAADFLSRRNLRTKVFVRFSTVTGPRGSPETARDPRGFSVKFYSKKDGNFDFVFNNLPVFFIRDQIKFPDLVHAATADPITNLMNPNRAFDFFSAIGGESTHMLTHLFSDLGIAKSYRFMDGNSVHAYKFVNASRDFKYVKLRWKSLQGVRNLTASEASQIQATDASHATRDLVEALREKKFPQWELQVQVMAPELLPTFDFDPLDATKVWPEDQFPFRPLGRLTINKLPDNFFLTTEQVAFDPGNFLPGRFEPSEDRLLQGRLLSYQESQTHRHGSNVFMQLPVNAPLAPKNNYNQGGFMVRENAWKGIINYEPSNDPNAFREDPSYLYSTLNICGQYEQKPIDRLQNFAQAGELFRSFSSQDQDNLISNLAGELGMVTSDLVRNKMCAHFFRADEGYGVRVAKAVRCDLAEVRRIAATLD